MLEWETAWESNPEEYKKNARLHAGIGFAEKLARYITKDTSTSKLQRKNVTKKSCRM
jgi:hypothetical protein